MPFPLQERYINLLTDFGFKRLKDYRDLNNVVDTSREEGRIEGREEGRIEQARSLLIRQLARKLGDLPPPLEQQLAQLSLETLDMLSEALFDFETTDDLAAWLTNGPQ